MAWHGASAGGGGVGEVPYTAITLGDARLHLLHTSQGRLFATAEVAAKLFQESPVTFTKELRVGRYAKVSAHTRRRTADARGRGQAVGRVRGGTLPHVPARPPLHAKGPSTRARAAARSAPRRPTNTDKLSRPYLAPTPLPSPAHSPIHPTPIKRPGAYCALGRCAHVRGAGHADRW